MSSPYCYPDLLELWFPLCPMWFFSLACNSVSHTLFFPNIRFFSPVIESVSVAHNQITSLTRGHSNLWHSSKLCYLLTRRYNTHLAGGRREGVVSLSQALPTSRVSSTFFRHSLNSLLPGAAPPLFTGAGRHVAAAHSAEAVQAPELYLSFPEHTQTQPPVRWRAKESVINGTLLPSMDRTGDGSASSESQPCQSLLPPCLFLDHHRCLLRPHVRATGQRRDFSWSACQLGLHGVACNLNLNKYSFIFLR